MKLHPIKKSKTKQNWNLNDFGFAREKNVSKRSNSTDTWDILLQEVNVN